MKISKSSLLRIIREELAPTVYVHDLKRRAKRAKSRELEKDFFGTDAGLTEPDTVEMPDAPSAAADLDKTVKLSPARQAALDKEREVIQAPERQLRDPTRFTITDFSKEVQHKLLLAYANKEGITIDPEPLGGGESRVGPGCSKDDVIRSGTKCISQHQKT